MDRTIQYDAVPSCFVRPSWPPNETYLVPPGWVQEETPVPPAFSKACLAEQNREEYHPEVYNVAVSFVREFEQAREFGFAPLLLGASGTGKTWAAAAIVNEITMRFGALHDLTTDWLSLKWRLPELMDFKTFRMRDHFLEATKSLRECDLLVLDDLLFVQEHDFSKSKSFVVGLLEYRTEHQHPTIITANALVTPSDWSPLEDVFGVPFVRRLKETSSGRTVVVT